MPQKSCAPQVRLCRLRWTPKFQSLKAVWQNQSMTFDLKRLPKASLDFIQPMLAKPANRLPASGDWLYELKLDGYRALALKKRGKVTLFSRRGNQLNERFPLIYEAFGFLPDNTMVDGEIVALDNHGKPSFSALQNSLRGARLYFYAFDLLSYRGKDLRWLPLNERRQLL